ncbi:hypothetical protein ACLKA7_017441 [Drosophila subpalustris]
MDKNRAIMELRRMPKTIKADAQTWRRLVANGLMRMEFYAKIFAKPNTRRTTDKRVRKHIRKALRNILETLGHIQQRTEYMWKRVRLFKDDEDLSHHCINCELTTAKLHDFLQFLKMRYDYEWEVKEMVVLALENLNNDCDVDNDNDILLAAWRDNRHAGGSEFDNKLREFFKTANIAET